MALMSKAHMRVAELRQPGCVKRLAAWLHMRTDGMSVRQTIRLLDWYFKRHDKKARGMTTGWHW